MTLDYYNDIQQWLKLNIKNPYLIIGSIIGMTNKDDAALFMLTWK